MTVRADGMTIRVLMLEDNEPDAELVLLELRRIGYRVAHERVFEAEALQEALGRGPWDIVLSDFEMPSFDALAAIRLIRAVDANVPILVVSGINDEKRVAAALQAGACDFIEKSRLRSLGPAIDHELRKSKVRSARTDG